MARARQRATEATDRRSEILDATLDLIADVGIDGLRSSLVADAAGVSLGLPHYYYPTLKDLVRAAFRRDEVLAREGYEAAIAGQVELPARARAAFAFPFTGPEAVRTRRLALWREFEGAAAFDAPLRRMVVRRLSGLWHDEITFGLEQGVEARAFAADADIRLSALRLAALHDGLMSFCLLGAIKPSRCTALIDGVFDRDPTVPARSPAPLASAPGGISEPTASADGILAAALRLTARVGLKGVHFPEVAEEAGVSAALPRYYFRRMPNLRRAAFAYDDERRHRMLAPAAEVADPLERLRCSYLYETALGPAAMRAHWAIWSELERHARQDQATAGMAITRLDRWRAFDLEQIEELIADGRVAATVDAEAAVDRMMATLEGAGIAFLLGMVDQADYGAIVDATIAWELGLEPGRPVS